MKKKKTKVHPMDVLATLRARANELTEQKAHTVADELKALADRLEAESQPRLPDPYYSDPMVTVYHGDACDILPAIPRVAVVITDPPYSEHVHSKSRAGDGGPKLNGRGKKGEASFSRTVSFGFDAITDELRSYVAQEFDRLAERWVLTFSDVESAHLWREDLELAGLDFVRTGLWIKIGATPQFTGDRPAAGAEAITIAHPRGKKRWNGGGSHAVWSVPIALDRDGKSPRYHTTEKPLKLMTKLVSLFSDPGETILDPFAGSGTTGLAAKELGRKAILIEANEEHCETIVERMRQEILPFDQVATGSV